MANFEVTRTSGEKIQVTSDRMEMGPNGAIIFLNHSRVAANGAGGPPGAVNLVRCFASGAWAEVLDQTANVHLPSGR